MRLYLYHFYEADSDPWQTGEIRDEQTSLRRAFEEAGGKPRLAVPHYAILGREWEDLRTVVSSVFEHPACVCLPVLNTMEENISFTYGSSVSLAASGELRVYTLSAVVQRIREDGWPQDHAWEGAHPARPRCIEAQIWGNVH